MAVYTHISEKDLALYLAQFDIGAPVSFSGIADGVENTNYRLVTTRGKFILTLFERRTKKEDLPFFLAFMTHLRDAGIPCPGVIPSRGGEDIAALNGKPAAITTFLEGLSPRRIEDFHAAAVGKILAQMHLAGKKFTARRDNALSLPAWRALIDLCGEKPEALERGLSPLLKTELEWQEKNRPLDLPGGAVHADLFPDNVFFTGKEITGIIDFYFSCTEVFAYDLMLAVNAWCFDAAGQMNARRAAEMLDAYRKERPLSAPEREALPFFGRAAALRIIATRLYDRLHPAPGAVVRLKDPLEYARILQFYRAGGFTP